MQSLVACPRLRCWVTALTSCISMAAVYSATLARSAAGRARLRQTLCPRGICHRPPPSNRRPRRLIVYRCPRGFVDRSPAGHPGFCVLRHQQIYRQWQWWLVGVTTTNVVTLHELHVWITTPTALNVCILRLLVCGFITLVLPNINN